jgi:hypothetical protein
MSASAVGELLAALVVIITLARVSGALAKRFGQPAVVGEILVGVVLGPTFFGAGLANHLGLSGRALDRFVSMLRGAGLNAELSGQVPDGALIVTRRGGPQGGAHLIVRAGPGYTPAESAQLVVADAGQADIGQEVR